MAGGFSSPLRSGVSFTGPRAPIEARAALLIAEASALRQNVVGDEPRGARVGCAEGKMQHHRRIAAVSLLWVALVACQTAPQRDSHCRRGKNASKPPAYADRLRSNEQPAPWHGPASPPTGFR